MQQFRTQQIQAVCFDLFNTLVSVGDVPSHIGGFTADILGVERQAWNKICFSDEHEICRVTDHFSTLKKLAHFLDPTISEATIQDAVMHRQRRFDYALREVEADVLSGLAQLRASGLKLVLVSNASTAEVKAWAESPLRDYFNHAIFSCECGSRKPEPAIYQVALEHLQLDAEQCLFVGDGGSNEHFGAKQCAMHPVLMTRFLSETDIQQKRQDLAGLIVDEVASTSELYRKLAELEA